MDANTVGAVAALTGVSVRTLHHYDHIGLVVPSVRTSAGYRGYTDADIERLHVVQRQHLAFGIGIRYCLDASLAHLEGSIALEEILNRFPEWDVDLDSARWSSASAA